MVKRPELFASRNLNLRQGPSAKHSVLDRLATGEPLELIRDEGDWLLVRHGQTDGYVSRRYVEQRETSDPTTQAERGKGGGSPRETLNKAILAFSAHAAAQTRFTPCCKINGLQPPILASRPWLTGNAIKSDGMDTALSNRHRGAI